MEKKLVNNFKIKINNNNSLEKKFIENHNKFFLKRIRFKKKKFNKFSSNKNYNKFSKKKFIRYIPIRTSYPLTDYTFFNPKIYRIFFNSLIKKGFRKKAHFIAWEIMQGIRIFKKFKKIHNHVIFFKVIKNLITPIRVREKKKIKKTEKEKKIFVPFLTKDHRTITVASKWIITNANKLGKIYNFFFIDSLIKEMNNVYNKIGMSFAERKNLEWVATHNRKNTKYLRKSSSISRVKNKIKKTKYTLRGKQRVKINKFKKQSNFRFNKIIRNAT